MMSASEYKILVKKYFLWTISLCLLVPGVFIAFVYTVDPMQFFHRAAKPDGPISGDMRAQAAGILNTFDIDSIILGTSMLENTSAKEASAKLGGKFFNISISAGDYAERAIILKRALQNKPKNIIYSVDNYYIVRRTRTDRVPDYLYDNNPLNDFKYYASLINLKKLFQEDRGLTLPDHDRPKYWFPTHQGTFGGIEGWLASMKNRELERFILKDLPKAASTFAANDRKEVHDQNQEKLAQEYVKKYILDVIDGHEDTNFYFILPPYFRYYYANQRRNLPKNYFIHQQAIRYLVESTKENKNVHIYGFEDMDFLDDIANYRDLTHYHPRFNSMFLDAIAAGEHELTPENVEDYLKRCEQKAWDFDIPALNARVQELLKAAEAKKNG